jgi:hypothetical protein
MKNLFEALSKFNLEKIEIVKNKTVVQNYQNKKTGNWEKKEYHYADLSEIISKCRPLLAKHGLSIIQGYNDKGNLFTTLAHSSGESITSEFKFPEKYKTDFNPMQSMGTDSTYIRRYQYQMIIGIIGEEDNDANDLASEIFDKKKTDEIVNKEQAIKEKDKHLTPGARSYDIAFGKYKGKKFEEVPVEELASAISWAKSKNVFPDVVSAGEKYLEEVKKRIPF